MFGYLRETEEKAIKEGKNYTGLDTYLKVIFPDVYDWEHDKTLPDSTRRIRPDYRSESLKLIVEFDGLPHYQKPNVIISDSDKNDYYTSLGYKVVRIPYFIQLTKTVVKKLFDVDVDCDLFPEGVPSMDTKYENTPAFLCPLGIKRMVCEFNKFPEQYKTNYDYLASIENDVLTGISLFEMFQK